MGGSPSQDKRLVLNFFAKISEYIRICEVDASESNQPDFRIMQMIKTVPVLIKIHSMHTIGFCTIVFQGVRRPNASK